MDSPIAPAPSVENGSCLLEVEELPSPQPALSLMRKWPMVVMQVRIINLRAQGLRRPSVQLCAYPGGKPSGPVPQLRL